MNVETVIFNVVWVCIVMVVSYFVGRYDGRIQGARKTLIELRDFIKSLPESDCPESRARHGGL